jgi:hypothetical protein
LLATWFRLISCLTCLLLRPWTWRRQVSPKRRLITLNIRIVLIRTGCEDVA